jgi:glucokinase
MIDHSRLALVGAIGGTYISLAVGDIDELTVHDFALLNSADFASPMEAIERYLKTIPRTPNKVGLSVAGEIDGDQIRMSHLPWRFSRNDLRAATGADHICVVNEFDALALALPQLSRYELIEVSQGTPTVRGTKLAISAGTGFGAAALVWTGDRWIPVSGHAHLLSTALPKAHNLDHVLARDGVVTVGSALCGRGLSAVYAAIAMRNGRRAVLRKPAEITKAALAREDEDAVETLEVVAGWLGELAGDLALTFGARGGVYLAGGLPSNVSSALSTPRFRDAFEGHGERRDYLAAIPIHVIKTGADANMRGAAVALAQSLPTRSVRRPARAS